MTDLVEEIKTSHTSSDILKAEKFTVSESKDAFFLRKSLFRYKSCSLNDLYSSGLDARLRGQDGLETKHAENS